ncbi:MAG: metallophosphoesterase [Gammaproteobacteria bacterium]|nr:metallophosphoesterase [Gammaproteobacteria bacterium]
MIFVKFALWFLLSEVILTILSFFIIIKNVKKWIQILIAIGELILSVVMALLPLAGPIALRPIQPFMMAFYVALFSDSIAKLIYISFCRIRRKDYKAYNVVMISIILGIIYFTYGVINMNVVTPKHYELNSSKLNNEYKIAFIADLHIGSAQTFNETKKTIDKVNKENPDLIILGGDAVDAYTTKEEMVEFFSLFETITTPTYFIYGNHDRCDDGKTKNLKFSEDELEDEITKNGIIILKDEFITINDDLILLGREDVSVKSLRKDETLLVNPDPNKFLLVADHQPVEFKENATLNMDLQLSGHTHAGQLFPLRTIYSFFTYPVGIFKYQNSAMFVSSGASGWRVPLRTESHSHYDIITIKPE